MSAVISYKLLLYADAFAILSFRNNSLNFGMKVALSTQDSSCFKFYMSIDMLLRSYCISYLTLCIPVAEDYNT